VITSANYLENGSASNNYKVPSITYDKHGNIKSLERLGKTSSGSTFVNRNQKYSENGNPTTVIMGTRMQ